MVCSKRSLAAAALHGYVVESDCYSTPVASALKLAYG